MSSDYLFARPSFLHGMARTLDLWASLDPYNWSRDGNAADARGMAADWGGMWADLSTALTTFAVETDDGKQRQLQLIFPAND